MTSKQIFLSFRLIIYLVMIAQLQFSFISIKALLPILYLLATICLIYDLYDLTKSYYKLTNTKKSKK